MLKCALCITYSVRKKTTRVGATLGVSAIHKHVVVVVDAVVAKLHCKLTRFAGSARGTTTGEVSGKAGAVPAACAKVVAVVRTHFVIAMQAEVALRTHTSAVHATAVIGTQRAAFFEVAQAARPACFAHASAVDAQAVCAGQTAQFAFATGSCVAAVACTLLVHRVVHSVASAIVAYFCCAYCCCLAAIVA